MVAALLIGAVIGGIGVYAVASQQINSLRSDVSKLSGVVSDLSGFQNVVNETVNVYQNGTALSRIYDQVKDSIVLVLGQTQGAYVLGTGFVYNASGAMVILTNNHVVNGTGDLSVTFSDGQAYSATVLGTDPYADLAVLSAGNAPQSEFLPLTVTSSSGVNVGDLVIAVGNPYGLIDSATMGIVSGIGRTITESQTGNVLIANVIQTSAPINPGNSGGPLLNYVGSVVGITTATVSGSDALGFAIPSDTLLKEVEALVTTGSYTDHSDLGAGYVDNDFLNAQQIGATITWGAVVTDVTSGGPSDGLLRINDIITSANGTRIQGEDELATFLQTQTFPGDSVELAVNRQGSSINVLVVLGRLS